MYIVHSVSVLSVNESNTLVTSEWQFVSICTKYLNSTVINDDDDDENEDSNDNDLYLQKCKCEWIFSIECVGQRMLKLSESDKLVKTYFGQTTLN